MEAAFNLFCSDAENIFRYENFHRVGGIFANSFRANSHAKSDARNFTAKGIDGERFRSDKTLRL